MKSRLTRKILFVILMITMLAGNIPTAVLAGGDVTSGEAPASADETGTGGAVFGFSAAKGGEDEEKEALVDGTLYYNEDLYLTGHIPGKGVVDVQPAEVTSPDGRKVLKAYDITVYANKKQQEKGKSWKPAGKKITVHWRDESFASAKELAVWHYANSSDAAGQAAEPADGGGEQPKQIETETENGWLTFETDSFSVYAVTGIMETDITAGNGKTYQIKVTFDSDSGIPENAVLAVDEILPESEDYENYVAVSEEKLKKELDDAKIFDIRIVDRDDPEKVYEPAEGSGVTVTVTLKEKPEYYANAAAHIVHIGKEGAEVRENTAEPVEGGYAYTFTADSLSPVVVGFTYDADVQAMIDAGAVARVSSDGGENWTYHSALVNGSGTVESGAVSDKGAFDYANTLSGDVVIETLLPTAPTYTLTTQYTFNGSKLTGLTLRTMDGVERSTLRRASTNSRFIYFNNSKSTFTVENMIFTGTDDSGTVQTTSQQGGILYLTSAGSMLRNVDFINCQETSAGGAVYANSGKLTVAAAAGASATFQNCKGTDGGAVYVNGSNVLSMDGNAGAILFKQCLSLKKQQLSE